MKLVVDTNILFSFFWKDSVTKKLLLNSTLDLISPEKALFELDKYSKDIIEKTKITKIEFDSLLKELQSVLKFISRKDYEYFLAKAEKISPDKDDADFFALCLKYNCFLWSNEDILKNQEIVNVLSTKEIINLLY